ncbi:MAG: hypothetical protein K2O52_01000, partial [Oscillospiraceae bacterium]|nr:hypothetical protein [Oscillospiraceae bacterium]
QMDCLYIILKLKKKLLNRRRNYRQTWINDDKYTLTEKNIFRIGYSLNISGQSDMWKSPKIPKMTKSMVLVCADLKAGVAVGSPYRLKYYGIRCRVRP